MAKNKPILTINLTGLDDVVSNLNKAISTIEGNTRKGMILVTQHIKAEAMDITPVLYGDLVGSAFGQTETAKGRTTSRVGYTAEYAPEVHEYPESYNYTKPGTGPKFLQKAITENTTFILRTLRENADIK